MLHRRCPIRGRGIVGGSWVSLILELAEGHAMRCILGSRASTPRFASSVQARHCQAGALTRSVIDSLLDRAVQDDGDRCQRQPGVADDPWCDCGANFPTTTSHSVRPKLRSRRWASLSRSRGPS